MFSRLRRQWGRGLGGVERMGERPHEPKLLVNLVTSGLAVMLVVPNG